MDTATQEPTRTGLSLKVEQIKTTPNDHLTIELYRVDYTHYEVLLNNTRMFSEPSRTKARRRYMMLKEALEKVIAAD